MSAYAYPPAPGHDWRDVARLADWDRIVAALRDEGHDPWPPEDQDRHMYSCTPDCAKCTP